MRKHLLASVCAMALLAPGAALADQKSQTEVDAKANAQASAEMKSGEKSSQDVPKILDIELTELGDLDTETLLGSHLRNKQGEELGSVDGLVLDKDGKITHVIGEIGGFLGMGEKLVAIPFDEIDIMKQDEYAEKHGRDQQGQDRQQAQRQSDQRQPGERPEGMTTAAGQDRGRQSDSDMRRTEGTENQGFENPVLVVELTRDELERAPKFAYEMNDADYQQRQAEADKDKDKDKKDQQASKSDMQKDKDKKDQQASKSDMQKDQKDQQQASKSDMQKDKKDRMDQKQAKAGDAQPDFDTDSMLGAELVNAEGAQIGEIDGLLMDKGGEVTHVVLATGGFLGLGEKLVAVPYDRVELYEGQQGQFYVRDLSKKEVDQASAFSYDQKENYLRFNEKSKTDIQTGAGPDEQSKDNQGKQKSDY